MFLGGSLTSLFMCVPPPQVFGLLAGLLLGYDAYISVPTRGGHSAAPTGGYGGAGGGAVRGLGLWGGQ